MTQFTFARFMGSNNNPNLIQMKLEIAELLKPEKPKFRMGLSWKGHSTAFSFGKFAKSVVEIEKSSSCEVEKLPCQTLKVTQFTTVSWFFSTSRIRMTETSAQESNYYNNESHKASRQWYFLYRQGN